MRVSWNLALPVSDEPGHGIGLSSIAAYEAVVERYRSELPTAIFSRIVNTSTRGKLAAARSFVSVAIC